jgi:8-oxo-dGTP diphosphatase
MEIYVFSRFGFVSTARYHSNRMVQMDISCTNSLRVSDLITVTAAVIQKDNRLFAARRKAGLHLGGLWEFPGGKLEKGESPRECLARELAEEFGIEAHVGRLLGENIHDYGEKIIKLKAYHVTHIGGEFHLREHDELRWLRKEKYVISSGLLLTFRSFKSRSHC